MIIYNLVHVQSVNEIERHVGLRDQVHYLRSSKHTGSLSKYVIQD